MGDSSQGLPLSASPATRGLFLRTRMICYQKLKAVISSFMEFNWLAPGLLGRSTGGKPLVEGYDYLWYIFTNIAFGCLAAAFLLLGGIHHPYIFVIWICPGCCFLLHINVLYSVVYWHRDMPFQLIGAKAKFMIEVIPLVTAAALRHLLDFNYGYPALLLGCTGYFCAYVHFLRVAYDIKGIDVMLGLVMQGLAYMLNVELLVRALVLSFCFGICFYRYVTYCAPEVPAHDKKELEQLPC
uniref:Uncharacterized protein n=1 Tax=Nicotiana tabacum TaxID=4097 RepID=A0A1S4DAL0_TOBAC|nr:PREDICTED: uncharacterized protein LOC107827794 [Nicotiana tabacum]XP_016510481.1 PREDICTED: uncharacterized protein LOC107827794 [Nicotiana tabacum]XP_016510482.1 PREDICTED: uncharacterized protein LOC107827794 [Nicotiana tabacum]